MLSNLLPGASWKKPPELMTLETCAEFYAGSKPPLGQYLSDGEEEEEQEGEKSQNAELVDNRVMSRI